MRFKRPRPIHQHQNTVDPSDIIRWLQDVINSDDLKVVLVAGMPERPPIHLVYIESLIDSNRIVEEIYEPLRVTNGPDDDRQDPRERLPQATECSSRDELLRELLSGSVALLREGTSGIYVLPLASNLARSIEQPTTEVQVLGPKTAFVEDLDTNLNVVRRRLPSPNLRIKKVRVGRVSQTEVAVISLVGVSNDQKVAALVDAVGRIDVDVLRDSVDLEEIVISSSLTPFPLAQKTERPDRVMQAVSNGRIAILVDGSPFALLVPTTLSEYYKDGETFLSGALVRVFIRWLRIAGLILATLAPSLYVALLSVDLHLFPSEILVTIARTREGIPYPILLEALVMLLVLDLVIEASAQSPTTFGQSLTIVGSLIIGQAAVQAQLASQLMVIVLAITSVGALLSPNLPFGYATRIAKYPLVIISGVLGLYGLTFGLLAVTIHLVTLKSFGTPYMAPMGPVRWISLRYYSLLSATKGNRLLRPDVWEPEDDVDMSLHGKRPR